jgi:3-deoxy-manno-octulosonate cytidylyltransferase (CMP-KDO synthetase)
MIEQHNTIIVIPTRMASRGLPGKPMADINGTPLIVHAWRQAVDAKLGAVLVAASENEVAEVIRKAGGDAMVIPSRVSSHQDRAAVALSIRDEASIYKYVVVLSGDLPQIDPYLLRLCLAGLTNEQVDVITLAAPLEDERDLNNLHIIKIVTGLTEERDVAYVRDYRRTGTDIVAPPYWQYFGISAFRRQALDRIAATPPSTNETARALEQMRALDMGLKVAAVRIDEMPLRVDSPAALERARRVLRKPE